MARVTNTFIQSSSKINREELADVVSRITPEDTPIYSMIRKGRCDSIHPEWPIDELDAPDDNAHIEGDEYTFDAITPATRVGNYTQIYRKTFLISGTQEAVSNAANVEKMRYQSLKKGVELRKDVEFSLVATQASRKSESSTSGSLKNGRRLGSIPTWLTSNVVLGVAGSPAVGGFKSSDGFTDAPTTGTQRGFGKADMDTAMQEVYEAGGNVKNFVINPANKGRFVGFINSEASTAQMRYAAQNGMNNSIVATADIYEGPFGKIRVVPNRVMSAGGRTISGSSVYTAAAATATRKELGRYGYFIDPSMMTFCWLRKIKRDSKVAKTGDAMKFAIVGEGTLKVHNEAAHGAIFDMTEGGGT